MNNQPFNLPSLNIKEVVFDKLNELDVLLINSESKPNNNFVIDQDICNNVILDEKIKEKNSILD